MADLSAAEVLAKLRELGDNSNPQKQIYKSQVAGRTVELFDLQGRPVLVRAEAIEEYTAKGFALGAPVPPEEVKPRPIRRGKTETPPAPTGDTGDDSTGGTD